MGLQSKYLELFANEVLLYDVTFITKRGRLLAVTRNKNSMDVVSVEDVEQAIKNHGSISLTYTNEQQLSTMRSFYNFIAIRSKAKLKDEINWQQYHANKLDSAQVSWLTQNKLAHAAFNKKHVQFIPA